MRRGWIYELLIALGLLILPLLFFWPVIFGGKTLIPFDNLYAFERWKPYANRSQPFAFRETKLLTVGRYS